MASPTINAASQAGIAETNRSRIMRHLYRNGVSSRAQIATALGLTPAAITNISFDHTQFLGNTLAEIAGEKAGIIKPGVPVVIGLPSLPAFHTRSVARMMKERRNVISNTHSISY